MPLSGGTAGAHDDNMHQGSAKRDVADGVAGLGPGGNVLAPGPDLELTRDGSENIEIVERTSGNIVFRWTRVGVNDFECRVNCGGVACIMQNDSMKDVVNGICALNGGGNCIVPGEEIQLTRDGSDRVKFVERTSAEAFFFFKRDGANDYTAECKSGGVNSVIQLANMKDVVNGIAGLDADKMLDPLGHSVGVDEFSTHLQQNDITGFWNTGVAGNGGAARTEHKVTLITGINVIGHARLDGQNAYNLVAKPVVFTVLIEGVVNGANGLRKTCIGLRNRTNQADLSDCVMFYCDDSNNWHTVTADGVGSTSNGISALVGGDIVSIIATSAEVRFFVNATLVQTHTTDLPTANLTFVSNVLAEDVNVTSERRLIVDMFLWKRYV